MRQQVFSVFIFFLFLNSYQTSFATFSEHIRVVGGENALADEFPSIVSLQIRGNHMCGGSLIASNWVLTAAHCVTDPSFLPDRVFMGTNNLQDIRDGESFRIVDIVVHTMYGENSPVSHDFALLKLHTDANYPIATLFEGGREELELSTLTVAGWGATFEDGFGTNILQRVDVPFISKEECLFMMQENASDYVQFIDDSMFCAGYDQGGKDSCQGDSGGPLYYWDSIKEEYIQAGVVSWGIGCARRGLPGMYGDISTVKDWVQTVIN